MITIPLFMLTNLSESIIVAAASSVVPTVGVEAFVVVDYGFDVALKKCSDW